MNHPFFYNLISLWFYMHELYSAFCPTASKLSADHQNSLLTQPLKHLYPLRILRKSSLII